jgi:hypothetical protein
MVKTQSSKPLCVGYKKPDMFFNSSVEMPKKAGQGEMPVQRG